MEKDQTGFGPNSIMDRAAHYSQSTTVAERGIVKRSNFIRSIAAMLALLGSASWSQGTQATRKPLEQAQSAVVQVTARAIEGASSARTLGVQRQGSGIVVGPDGLILTIGYLVLETEQISVRTRDQKTFPARVVAFDTASGLAILRPLFPLPPIEPVVLGRARVADVGQLLAVVSADQQPVVEPARLIDLRAFTGYWEYHLDQALYASPAVSQHSGAALLNGEGQLLGIGSLFMQDILPEDDPRALAGNMFVPVELISHALQQLRNGETPQPGRRPWLGINAVERNGRIQVTRVTPQSPADQAGLLPGMYLLSLDGEAPSSLADFYKKLWSRPLDSGTFRLRVQARGVMQDLEVAVRDRGESLQMPAGI